MVRTFTEKDFGTSESFQLNEALLRKNSVPQTVNIPNLNNVIILTIPTIQHLFKQSLKGVL